MALTLIRDPRLAAYTADPSTITKGNSGQVRATLLSEVGTGDAPLFSTTSEGSCEYEFGDGAIWNFVESLMEKMCSALDSLAWSLFNFAQDMIAVIVNVLAGIVSKFIFAFNGLVDAVSDKLAAAISAVLLKLESVVGKVVTALGVAINAVITTVSTGIGKILTGIKSAVDTVIDKAKVIFTTVTAGITKVVTTVSGVLASASTKILAGVSKAVNAAAAVATKVIGAIKNGIAIVLNGLNIAIGKVVSTVTKGFGLLLTAATTVLSGITTGIGKVIAVLVDKAAAVFNTVSGALAKLMDTLTGAAEKGLGAVRSVIEDIPKALRELAGDAFDVVGDVVGKPLANIGTLIVEQIEAFFKRLIDELEISPGKIIRDFLQSLGLPPDVADRFATAANRGMPITPLPYLLATLAIVPLLLLPMIHTAASPLLEELRQESNQLFTPSLLPVNTAVDARLRELISESELTEDLSQAGFNAERIKILQEAARRFLSIQDVVSLWLRGLLNNEDFDKRLRWMHFTQADIDLIKQVVFFIPPVQDLISMAVREVFSPDIRQRFGLDDDFPSEFSKFAHQQGISEEWAKNYWAAHWILPSVNQGFEMLHRRVITIEDLDLLMRTQDIMPFWRENLKKIAFAPLTRVDVRRMHDLGLITDDDLQLRYMDLGFNEDNADMMKAFTIAYNQPDPPELIELEGLTRGTILNMFDDGILTEEEATDILLTLGVGETAAELFITQRQLERQRKERKAILESIIELATGAVIDLPEAQDSLARIGMTALEIASAVQQILRNRDSRDRLPTLAELTKMQRELVIDTKEWQEAMAGQGFPDVWIERLELVNQLAATSRDREGTVRVTT